MTVEKIDRTLQTKRQRIPQVRAVNCIQRKEMDGRIAAD